MTRGVKMQLIGWVLFVLCAVAYIIASLESQSLSSLIGSAVFLVACVFFMIPLLWGDV